MNTRAYILIETAVGRVREAVEALRKLPGVKTVDVVSGPYDVIVVVEGIDLNAIGDLVAAGIHPIPGITRTITCLTI